MSAAGPRFADELAAFAQGAIGAGLSPEVHALIDQAAQLQDQPTQAQSLLEQARAAAPRHPAPLIALYRFHFYGHRLEQALVAGEDALAVARTALGSSFGDEPPSDDEARHDAAVRFYLFALKALAYLHLRLGQLDEAKGYLHELRRLDPRDHVGGGLLSHILHRHRSGSAPTSDYPVRGWRADAS